MVSEITNDEDLQLFLDPCEGYEFFKKFIQIESLSNLNEMPAVNLLTTEWDGFISILSSDPRNP